MDIVVALGMSLIAIASVGLLVSIGNHRSKSVALPSIALGSTALILMLILGLFIALTHRTVEIPILGMKLGCDAVSLIVLVNVVILGIASLVASYSYCDIVAEHGYGPYYMLIQAFLLSMSVIPLTRDWLWFLFFWEVMTLSSYFLVGYEYHEEEVAKVAWNYFVVMHILCTLPLVVAMGILYGYERSFDFATASLPSVAIVMFLLGFATKSGLFPLHFWLPDAHPVAPTPVSALLSGAMVEMGVYGMYRVSELYGNGHAWLGPSILVMALLSTLAAVLSYHRQDDAKRLFAWSTIDNAGWMYLYLALGAGGTPLAIYILNHGLAKAAAFLSTGLVLYTLGTRSIRRLKGCFSIDRIAVGALILSIFALEGVPPFNFFWSKFDVVRRALVTNPGVGIAYALLWTIAFVSFLHVVHKLVEAKHVHEDDCTLKRIRNAPKSMVATIVTLLALLLVSNYLCQIILNILGCEAG